MCMLLQNRGGMCFCRLSRPSQSFSLLRPVVMSKNRDTSRGSPAGARADRGTSHKTASLVTQLSRHGATITYTDLLCAETIHINASIASLISLSVESLLYPFITLRIILFSSRIKKTGTPEI
jgi:hypothetical protein